MMKLPGLSLLTLAVVLPLSASHAQQCVPTNGYSLYVSANANASTHTVNPAKVESSPTAQDRECYVEQKSAIAGKEVNADGAQAKFSAAYHYEASARGLTLTVGVTGGLKTKSCPNQRSGGSCGGKAHSSATIGWQDTITLHTKSRRVLTASDLANGQGVTDADRITVKVRLYHQEDCRNNGAKPYFYISGVGASLYLMNPGTEKEARKSARGILTSVVLGGDTNGAVFPGQDLNEDKPCALSKELADFDAMNGIPIRLNITVSSEADGGEDAGEEGASVGQYDVHATREGVRLCLRRPQTPADLTMTSASGASYWCDDTIPPLRNPRPR